MTHIPHPTIMAQTLAREIAALGVELDQAKALALVERMHARHQGETEDLFEGKLVDWQDHPAPRTEDVKEWQASLTRHGVQLNFNLAPPHKETKELDGRDQLALWVEVNDGRPCMHISTAL